MKKLQKLKLNELSVEALENREMNQLAGGCSDATCICSCCYQGPTSGGSSSYSNALANADKGLVSYHPTHENEWDCDSTGSFYYDLSGNTP